MTSDNLSISDSETQVNKPTFYSDMARLLTLHGVTGFDIVVHIKYWLNNDEWCDSLTPHEHDEFISTVYRTLAIIRENANARQSDAQARQQKGGGE